MSANAADIFLAKINENKKRININNYGEYN